MKKLLLILLAIFTVLPLAASCGEDTDAPETTKNPETSTEESEAPAMLNFDPSEYVVIYPNNGFKEKYLALLISNAIEKSTDVKVPYKDASASPERECEILIGETDRPESKTAIEMAGDGDIVIAVINKKIVIWASNDELYDAVAFRFGRLLAEAEIPADLCIVQDIVDLDIPVEGIAKNTSFSFSTKLLNDVSVVAIKFGDKYVIEFSKDSVGLYEQGSERTELAQKVVHSEIGKAYEVTVTYDGEYLRAYIEDPELGLEPWSVFELLLPDLPENARIGELSGFGAEFSEPVKSTLSAPADGVTYQNNVVLNAADPDILYFDGYYYMYVTGDKYPVYRSADLAKWEYVGVSLPEVSWNIDKKYMWAPDVEYINGKFYMAVSMGEFGFGIAVADKPEGPFVCAGDMPFLTKTIDGHIFVDDDGRIYLYYTSWCDGRAYGIWGVEMESDCLTPKWETEKLIFTPTEPWESTMNRGGVVEAPYMLKKEGVYYLVYSGSHFEADYAVGYATSTNPLEGFTKSENNPILRGTADTRGTGHCSIVETPTGGMVMVYHAHNTPTTVQPRHVAIDPVRFVKTSDGYRLEVCGPTTSKIPVDIFK